jgi:hypothetical protein
MSREKYIGGAFAKNDSVNFKVEEDSFHFFQFPNKHLVGFETGADALAWILLNEIQDNNRPVYFPLHYCQETIERVCLKVPDLDVKRYRSPTELSEKTAIVVWNHFNGFCPVPKDLLNISITLIEDCVQSLKALHEQVGTTSFTSLRKWMELDLAVVVSNHNVQNYTAIPSKYFQEKKKAEELKQLWKTGKILDENEFLKQFASAEKALQRPEIYFRSLEELNSYNWNAILAKRQTNARILINFLKTSSAHLIETNELFVMIQIKERDQIRRLLAQAGIFAPVHWLDSEDKDLAKSLLSLPIDQRFDAADMERIVTELKHGFNVSGI